MKQILFLILFSLSSTVTAQLPGSAIIGKVDSLRVDGYGHFEVEIRERSSSNSPECAKDSNRFAWYLFDGWPIKKKTFLYRDMTSAIKAVGLGYEPFSRGGMAMYETLMQAKLHNLTVTIWGTGNCEFRGNLEGVLSVILH